MKITGFRVETFTYSRGRMIGDANGVAPDDNHSGSLLFIETDENITGIATRCPSTSVISRLFPVIEGQDPRSSLF